MQEIDSGALELVNKTLQLGVAGPQMTHLDAATLQQTLSVNEIVRRSLTPVGSTGIFGLTMRNSHVAAGNLTATFDPYGLVPGTTVRSPWPALDQMEDYDVWMLGPFTSQTSGGGGGVFGGAILDVLYAATRNSDIDITGAMAQRIMVWQAETAATVVGAVMHGDADGNVVCQQVSQRIPRGCTIRYLSNSTGVGTPSYSLACSLGVFPRALGQDAVG